MQRCFISNPILDIKKIPFVKTLTVQPDMVILRRQCSANRILELIFPKIIFM